MSITVPPNKRRDVLLRMPIGEMAGWHLAASCGQCRQERRVGLRELAERFGPDAKLVVLIPRLRCHMKRCRRPPARLRLRNRLPGAAGPPLLDVLIWDRPVQG